jgi:hypothetical protein
MRPNSVEILYYPTVRLSKKYKLITELAYLVLNFCSQFPLTRIYRSHKCKCISYNLNNLHRRLV